ncbi:MAG: hypothetical protein IJ514_07720 [Clostridia bacterium]|nr:hypothetical protein [Clostridia bacterium]
MKRIFKLLSMVVGFCLLCASFFGCNSTTTASAEELSYISMRINPEIELVVDEEGEVVAVNAINEDGETVLCELELIGMTAEEAGEAFTAMATELGFIDVDGEDATVYILVEGNDTELMEKLEEKITEKINGFFDKKGIFGKVSPEELEAYEALAAEWEVSLKDARMISRILELYPEMTVEEILALSFEERIELIKEDSVKNGMPIDLRNEYREAVDAVKEEYAELFELAKELKDLETQLQNESLSEEDRALIQEEYDTKKAEYDELKKQYEEAVAALKAEKSEKAEEIENEIKEKAKERRDEFAEKLKEHEDKLQEQKEEIEDKIKQWRENRK